MAKAVFTTDGSYKPLFDHIKEAGGADLAEKICAESNAAYERLVNSDHTDLNNTAKMHWKQCCERAAIYTTVRKYYPESVLEWINESLEKFGLNAAAALNRIIRFPGMKALFLPIMRSMAKSMFGSKGGFRNQFGLVTKQEVHFDILECPYCKYMKELDCPELGPGFCKSDEYSYGNLRDFTFERTQTLAIGGEKCDFCMRRNSSIVGKTT